MVVYIHVHTVPLPHNQSTCLCVMSAEAGTEPRRQQPIGCITFKLYSFLGQLHCALRMQF